VTDWLTVPEAVAYLRVSRATLYTWMKKGLIPYYTVVSGRRRLKRADLDAVYLRETSALNHNGSLGSDGSSGST
jgi:excisionase family DNA binding protein